ncbi:MAG TPA: phage antirepressor [Desulfobacteraceae bacterium]|nr:phage antirepressor [Desulfobacteraceae bacterium]
MHNTVIPFDYDSRLVRVVPDDDGNPWWVAGDVCKVLDIQDAAQCVQRLEDDERLIRTLHVSGQNREMWTVNEPGIYTLIIRSNKPEAKAFKRWITHEVLPTIRRTGGYQIPDSPGYLSGDAAKRSGKMYFPMAKLVESADKFLEGKAALTALNYFTGMPVDALLEELEEKQTSSLEKNIRNLVLNPSQVGELLEDFLSEECELHDDYEIAASEAYTAFTAWCKGRGLKRPVSRKRFGSVVSENFDKVKRGVIFYLGFRLLRPAAGN